MVYWQLLGITLISILMQGEAEISSPEQPDNRTVGYEMLDSGEVLHFWNVYDDYYVYTSSGIQLTNHYDDYWSRNIFCSGFNISGWEFDCVDELPLDGYSIDTDDSTYINITGWFTLTKTVDKKKYKIKFYLLSHLKDYDNNLTVIITAENVGNRDLPYDLGIAWKITDIDIGKNNNSADYLYINESYFDLNTSFNNSYSDLEEAKIYLADEITGENLWLSWDKNLSYVVDTNNQTETLIINVGNLSVGQKKQSTFYWFDDICAVYCTMNQPTSNVEIEQLGTYTSQLTMTWAGGCTGSQSVGIQWHDGVVYTYMTTTSNLSITGWNPTSGTTQTKTVTGKELGLNYMTVGRCQYGRRFGGTGARYVNVTETELGNCTYYQITTDTTLSANNYSCFNITSDDVTLDCNGYSVIGNQEPEFYSVIVSNSDDVVVKNCNFYDRPQVISVLSSDNFRYINNTANDGERIQPTGATIRVMYVYNSSNTTAENSSFNNFYSNNTNSGASSLSDHTAIYLDNTTDFTAYNITCFNITGSYVYWAELIFYREPYGVCMKLNISNHTAFLNGKVNITGRNYAFQHETQHNNYYFDVNNSNFHSSGIRLPTENVTAYNNSVYNPPQNGIYIGYYTDVAVIDSNSVFMTTSNECFADYSACVDCRIINNYCDGNNNNSQGIAVSSNDLIIKNNVFENFKASSGSVVYLWGKNNVIIDNNTFRNMNYSGIRSGGIKVLGTNITITNNYMENFTQGAGYIIASNSQNIINATMINFSDETFYLYVMGSNELNCTDCTYNKSLTITFESSNHFYNRYTTTINITNSTESALSGVNVSVYNLTNDLVFDDLTGASGLLTTILIEFYQNSTDRTYHTNHTINATLTSYDDNVTSHNINFRTTINLTMYVTSLDLCPVIVNNWNVSENTTCYDQIINVTGNLRILNDVYLRLYNVTGYQDLSKNFILGYGNHNFLADNNSKWVTA